jgi:subtilisin family serine protease
MFLWCAGLPNGRLVPAQLARGADVISNSWTLEGMADSGDVAAAFDVIADSGRTGRGCVLVFAAGNHIPNGTDYTVEYPLATHRAVIAVAASTVAAPEVKVSTSNFGPGIDLCAPAGDGTAGASTYSTSITQKLPASSDYDYFGQTSAACPQVAGVAALMIALNPSLDAEQIRDMLHTTAVPIDTINTDPDGSYDKYGHSQWYGYGRLDAQAAVQAAQAAAPPAAVSAPAAPTGVRIVI